ncbi:MAG: hypothetical protein MZV64_59410 [Ignavibacteriales bacterium]|nr:hypothetical protein [Ignavibacteriales bacterium]
MPSPGKTPSSASASSSEWLFFLILPVVFTFLLAGGTPIGQRRPRIRLLVVDQAQHRHLAADHRTSWKARPRFDPELTDPRGGARSNSTSAALRRC